MQKISPKNILEASGPEIRAYAENFLGLDIEPDESDNAVFAKVMAAGNFADADIEQNKVTIFVIDQGEPTDQTGAAPQPVAGASEIAGAPEGMAGTLGRDDPKVELIINSEERNGETYTRDVALGVNGVCWQLQRDKVLKVPYRVYLALKAAVKDVVTHDPNTHEERHASVNSVPFNVQSMPSREEIAAWHQRVDALFCP